MEKIKILIYTEKPESASLLTSILNEMGYYVVHATHTYRDTVRSFFSNLPDLILLDVGKSAIQSGIQLVERVNRDPKNVRPVIILTDKKDKSHFEKVKKVSPFACLVKPFNKHSLKNAIELALDQFSDDIAQLSSSIYDPKNKHPENIFIRKRNKILRVPIKDIMYVEVQAKYCTIHSSEGRFLLRTTLKEMNEILPCKNFVRIHRNYIINLNEITEMDFRNSTVTIGNRTFPVARSYKNNIANNLLVLQ